MIIFDKISKVDNTNVMWCVKVFPMTFVDTNALQSNYNVIIKVSFQISQVTHEYPQHNYN
jgi:hypothetical protein